MAIGYGLSFSVVYLVYTVSSAQAIQCKGTAKYTLTFQGEWSSATHPKDFPSNPHFSSLVGCSHNASYVMWRPGEKATKGVEDVAETGSFTELNKEMDIEIASMNAHKRYRGDGIRPGTASRVINNIEVTSEYSLVSFITMIAPSPDWFVGVRDFDLCDRTSGEWLKSRARDLPPYDAGTDTGLNFESPNNQTSPHINIHLLTNNTAGSFRGDKPVKKFGTFTFVKTFDSNPVKPSSSNILQPSKSQYRPSMPRKSSGILTSPIVKASSTQQADMESTSSTRTTVPTQILNQTATVITTKITPTFSTTSGACSVKQFSFIHAVFSLMFVILLL